MQELEFARELAEKAVAEGDGTLKKANFTYHTLSGFKNQVEESKQKAAEALETVPSIERQIDNAIELIANSEAVSAQKFVFINFVSIWHILGIKKRQY